MCRKIGALFKILSAATDGMYLAFRFQFLFLLYEYRMQILILAYICMWKHVNSSITL